jgi:hypothetical protein
MWWINPIGEAEFFGFLLMSDGMSKVGDAGSSQLAHTSSLVSTKA